MNKFYINFVWDVAPLTNHGMALLLKIIQDKLEKGYTAGIIRNNKDRVIASFVTNLQHH